MEWFLDTQDVWHATSTGNWTPATFRFAECDEQVKTAERTQDLPFGITPDLDSTCDVCVAEVASAAK